MCHDPILAGRRVRDGRTVWRKRFFPVFWPVNVISASESLRGHGAVTEQPLHQRVDHAVSEVGRWRFGLLGPRYPGFVGGGVFVGRTSIVLPLVDSLCAGVDKLVADFRVVCSVRDETPLQLAHRVGLVVRDDW